jgi:hypothetical protein
MKKQVFLFSIFIVMFFASFVIAEEIVCEDNDCKIDKAHSCLEEKIDDKECDNLASEEKVFSFLATGKCKAEVLDDSKYKSDIKYTAQVILGLKESNSDSTEAEEWLFEKNRTTTGIDWFLEIESPEATSCTVSYSSSNQIEINEDKTINFVSGGNCLSSSANGYWIGVSSNCYDEDFTISCDKQFLTTLLYQKQGDDTIYVSEKTSSASAEGTTEEKVESFCFGENGCDYEGTLWAVLALNALKSDTDLYISYLTTFTEDHENLLPESFLYFLTGKSEFKNQLLGKQINSKWWVALNNKYYGTALTLSAFRYEEPLQKQDSIEWLFNDVQGDDGCWDSGNIKNTAFLLYTISPRITLSGTSSNDSSGSGGISDLDCENSGYSCVSQINCAGGVLSGYDCSGAFVCCSEGIILETCSERGGEICNSNQNCIGTGSLEVSSSDLSHGQACCLSGVCQESQDTTSSTSFSQCEVAEGTCRINNCHDSEKEISESCDFSSDICCVGKTSEAGKSYLWVWILFFLIVLVVLGIIFRDKLRPYWLRIKSKFSKFSRNKGSSASSPTPIGPGTPPPGGFPLRRVMPRRTHQAGKRPLRRMPRAKSQGEVDEVLKKLKEMGK